MASLALPGMSGFVGELSVFLGVTTSSAYSSNFKVVVVGLAAVGLILTPIYLLNLLRQVFYGENNYGLIIDDYSGDAKPREVIIAVCLLLPIIGIGVYPKLATRTYDIKTVEVASQVREIFPIFAQQQRGSVLYSGGYVAPKISDARQQPLLPLGDVNT